MVVPVGSDGATSVDGVEAGHAARPPCGAAQSSVERAILAELRAAGVTSTEVLSFKRSRFSGHAAPVKSAEDIQQVLAMLRRPHVVSPYAYRLQGWDPASQEGCSDGGDSGVGDKLLHLLQEWDVENVVLVVCRDDSKSLVGGDSLGVRRFKIVIDCAKAVLELCYLESLRHDLGATAGAETTQVSGEGGTPPPSARRGARLGAPPPPVPTGIVRRNSRGSLYDDTDEDTGVCDTGVRASKPNSIPAHSPAQPKGIPPRPLGPDAIVRRPEPRPVLLPSLADLEDSLPPDRPVSTYGVEIVQQRGQVNNFRNDHFRNGIEADPRAPLGATASDFTVFADAASDYDDSPTTFVFGVAVPRLSRQECAEIRTLRQPHADVDQVFRCVCCLVFGETWLRESGGAMAWVDVRRALSAPGLNARLQSVRPDALPIGAAEVVYLSLTKRGLDSNSADQLRIKNVVAAGFVPWLWACIDLELQDALVTDDETDSFGLPIDDNPTANESLFAAGKRLVAPTDAAQRRIERCRVEAVLS